MGLAEGSAGFWSCVCLTTLGLPPDTMRLNLDPQIKSSTFCSTFDNASGGYTGVILFLIVCLNYLSIRNKFEKNVSPQKAQSHTQ